MNDENAIRSLQAVIEALNASISMQKAVANNLVILVKLRTYGYSNKFISSTLSNGSGKTISPGLLASMMYRARMKTSLVDKLGSTEIVTPPGLPKIKLQTTTPQLDTSRLKSEIKDRDLWDKHFGTSTKSNGDRRREDFTHDSRPNLEIIYSETHNDQKSN